MTAKTLAEMLNGMEYPMTVPTELENEAKREGLVIVYGASDDLMEFEVVLFFEGRRRIR